MANILAAFAEAAVFVLHTFIKQCRDTYSITNMKRAINIYIYPQTAANAEDLFEFHLVNNQS